MRVSELIKELKTVHPDADVIIFSDRSDENFECGGILVTGNDDDYATEVAILTKDDCARIFDK